MTLCNSPVVRLPVVRLIVLILLFGLGHSAHAQYACSEELGEQAGARPYDNPCPAADDLELPLPGKLSMTFRKVPVPGGEFWGNPSRNVELGDPQARMFEGPRLVSVAGSFLDETGNNWMILLGKYEVSVAQYVAVLGDGDMRAGITLLAENNPLSSSYLRLFDEDISSGEVRKILASPVRGLRAGQLEDFTRLYTDWCYRHEVCFKVLPSFGTMPGFFRLPTEIEWEFSARRHSDEDSRVSFLPFDNADATQYAYISTTNRVRERPTSIGRLKPTAFGIHDLYGNVAELVDGRFYAELGQGKPGMHVSRGDSFAHTSAYSQLRPSSRAEVQGYRINEQGQVVPVNNERLGIRLAIGSQTVPDLETLTSLQQEYDQYRSTDRLQSASGKSTQASLLDTAEPLNKIDELVESFSLKSNLPTEFREQLKQLTDTARVNLVRTSETLAGELVERATTNAAEAGRALWRERTARNSADKIGRNDSASAKRMAADLERKAQSYATAFHDSVRLYQDTIARLASYREFATASLQVPVDDATPDIFKLSRTLLTQHTEQALQGNTLSTDEMAEQFQSIFSDDSIFEIVDK